MGMLRGQNISGRLQARHGIDFSKSHARCSGAEIKFKTGDTLGATSTVAGTSMRWLSYNTAVTGKNALELKLDQSGILATQNTSRGLYVNVNNISETNIVGELVAGEFKVRSSSSNSPDVKGIHVCVDAKAYNIALARGIEISIDAGENVHGSFDTVQGLRVAGNWSGTINTAAKGIVIEGPATWTYGIDLSGGTIGTADIRLSQGETISNLTNGTISMGGHVALLDTSQVILGTSSDAIFVWDTAEANDCLKIGINDASNMSIAYMAADMIGSDISVPAKTYPAPFWYYNDGENGFVHIGMYSIAGSATDLMMTFKASAPNATFTWMSYLDTDNSNFMQRRLVDTHYENWYLDTCPILWSNSSDDGGIFLARKDAEPWAPWITGNGSQMLGIANNDGTHFIYFYVDTSGDLHIIDEAGNDAKIVTSAGTITPA